MKNKVSISIVYILIGVLLILIPTQLLPVCSSNEMRMACYYTKQAEIGLGIFVLLNAAILILTNNSLIRLGISISQFISSLLVILYPAKLIGLCKMSEMQCSLKTYPALIITGVILAAISVGNIIYIWRKTTKDDKQY